MAARRRENPVLPVVAVRRERVPQVGGQSPWGTIQSVEVVNDDGSIRWADTPGHGGVWVSKIMLDKMPECLRTPLDEHWFEEDCEWAKVYVAFPDLEGGKRYEYALSALFVWNHGLYKQHFGLQSDDAAREHVRRNVSSARIVQNGGFETWRA